MIEIPLALLPRAINSEAITELYEDCKQLWLESVEEYFDSEHSTRTHGSPKTYQAGCRGPFCLAGIRRQRRNISGHVQSDKYSILDPIIEHYFDTISAEDAESRIALKAMLLSPENHT